MPAYPKRPRARKHAGPILAGALLSLLPVLPAGAQTIDSPYRFIEERHEVTVFSGVAGDNTGTLGIGPSGGLLVGVRYGLELTDTAGLDGSVQFLSATRVLLDPTGSGPAPVRAGETDEPIVLLEARGRFNLTGGRTWHSLAPYLFGGAGLAVSLGGTAPEEAEWTSGERFQFGPSLVGSFGGGIRWLFGRRLGARLEGSMHLWKLGNPPAFRSFEEEIGPVEDSEWTGWPALTLGASYRF